MHNLTFGAPLRSIGPERHLEVNGLSATKSNALKLASWYMQRRLRESLELMREGRDPRDGADEFSNSVTEEEGQVGSAGP